jgi:DNA (cytosine-5)-methyltransferase 1
MKLTFIDLFAGIGGTRLGFERAGCKCVFSSEWDKYSQITYEANYCEKPLGNIREIPSESIPDHDILVAGFPCQPFSISGVSKKNSLGKPHGFSDLTQGTLFFEIKRILRDKQPQAFLLENVKNLKNHDNHRTFKVITDVLANELGYTIYNAVIDADKYVPQHRERIYIVGFREPRQFSFPNDVIKNKPKLVDILEKKVPDKYTLTDHLWKYLQQYSIKHKEKGNGFGYGLADLQGKTRTLSARYYKDGSEILIPQEGNIPRRLTPRECARLMGFPESFKIPVSDTQAYKQFGNSVVVPVVYSIAKEIVSVLNNEVKTTFYESNYQIPLPLIKEKKQQELSTPLINIEPKTSTYFRNTIIKYEVINGARFAWRTTPNKWHALVAEVMLQRTQAPQVEKAYLTFTSKFTTPSGYLNDNNPLVFTSLGLKWREKTFRQLAEELSNTNIPSDTESLLKLPSIGDYIASAFRSLHLGIRDYIIDSNVVRLYGRYFGFETDGETRRKKWFIHLAEKLTPNKRFKEYNYGLIDFTREICRLKPRCSVCVLNRKCSYFTIQLVQ